MIFRQDSGLRTQDSGLRITGKGKGNKGRGAGGTDASLRSLLVFVKRKGSKQLQNPKRRLQGIATFNFYPSPGISRPFKRSWGILARFQSSENTG